MQTPAQLSFLCRALCRGITAPASQVQQLLGSYPQAQQTRGMALWVPVEDNNVEFALRKLNRKIKESGLQDELMWRRHHIPRTKMRFYKEQQAYNNEMGRRITQKLYWLKRRKYVEASW